MANILVVEDDVAIAELVQIHLRDEFHEVEVQHDGRDGFLAAAEAKHDLIVLDLMLPGMNGMDICRKLRENRVDTPILMLTSKSDEVDKILGLEGGADDYMTKPFSVRELQARVKAILRRQKIEQSASADKPVINTKDLLIDAEKHKVEVAGRRLDLTPKEFELLYLMAKTPGKTYSRTHLLQEVWGNEFSGYEHTVNTHINRLRAKLEADPNQPKYILTTWGVGYRFTDEF